VQILLELVLVYLNKIPQGILTKDKIINLRMKRRKTMSLVDKMLDFLGFDEEQTNVGQEEVFEPEIQTISSKKNHTKKIINIYETSNYGVNTLNVIDARSFEDVREVSARLKNKQPVIINLENIEKSLSQRMVDFISGAVDSLEGEIKKMSSDIFIVTPNNFRVEDINNESIQEEIHEEKSVLPWMN